MKKQEFLELLKLLGACSDGIEWVEKHPSDDVKEILSNCRTDWLTWLLREQPQFIGKFDLSKLDGNDISWLLRDQPQLKKHFKTGASR